HLNKGNPSLLRTSLLTFMLLLVAALGVEVYGQWMTGLRPQESAYAAAVYALSGLQGLLTCVCVYMSLFAVIRSAAGRLSAIHRACYDSTMLMGHYTVAQGLLILGMVHGFPRLTG